MTGHALFLQLKAVLSVVLNLFAERAKSRLTTLLESHAKEILTQFILHVLFYCRVRSVAHNITGVVERLLRAEQWLRRSRMRLSER